MGETIQNLDPKTVGESETTQSRGFPKKGSKELRAAVIRELFENETGIGALPDHQIDPELLKVDGEDGEGPKSE